MKSHQIKKEAETWQNTGVQKASTSQRVWGYKLACLWICFPSCHACFHTCWTEGCSCWKLLFTACVLLSSLQAPKMLRNMFYSLKKLFFSTINNLGSWKPNSEEEFQVDSWHLTEKLKLKSHSVLLHWWVLFQHGKKLILLTLDPPTERFYKDK